MDVQLLQKWRVDNSTHPSTNSVHKGDALVKILLCKSRQLVRDRDQDIVVQGIAIDLWIKEVEYWNQEGHRLKQNDGI